MWPNANPTALLTKLVDPEVLGRPRLSTQTMKSWPTCPLPANAHWLTQRIVTAFLEHGSNQASNALWATRGSPRSRKGFQISKVLLLRVLS